MYVYVQFPETCDRHQFVCYFLVQKKGIFIRLVKRGHSKSEASKSGFYCMKNRSYKNQDRLEKYIFCNLKKY